MERSKVAVIVEFEADTPTDEELDDLVSAAEGAVLELFPSAHSVFGEIANFESV